METKTITMRKCLIMFFFLLFALFISILTERNEDIRPNKVLLVEDNTSEAISLTTDIKR